MSPAAAHVAGMPAGPAQAPAAATEGTALGTDQLERGALVFFGFAALFVALFGPRLDELLQPAQIITGAVTYPAGHPHLRFYTGVYSLLDYLAAGLLFVVRDVRTAGAILNVLFLGLSGYVPFVAAALLTGRASWGYVAGAFVLLGSTLRLEGTYPMYVFPEYFTNGHVGAHAGVLAMVLLLHRRWRAGAVLIGLLPAVHGAVGVLIWAWTGLHFLLSGAPARGERRAFAGWVAAGLAGCAALAGLIAWRTSGIDAASPYVPAMDTDLVYRAFTDHTDAHRRPFDPFSFGYLVNPAVFFALAGGLLLRARAALGATRVRGLLLFGLVIWGAVYAIRTLSFLDLPVPTPLNVLMFNRFSNLSALLLVPLAIAALGAESGRRQEPASSLIVLLPSLLLAGGGLLALVNHALAVRNLLIALVALVFAAWLTGSRGRERGAILALGALVAASMLPMFPATNVLLYYLLALAGACMILSFRAIRPLGALAGRHARMVLLCTAAAAGGIGALFASRAVGADIVPTAFDAQLREWMRQNASQDDLILPAIAYPRLQIVSGNPVLMEWHTIYLMSYWPGLAGTIGTMARDLYGIDYTEAPQLAQACGGRLFLYCSVWDHAWENRTRAEWSALAGRYGFHFVLAPAATALDLERVFEGERWALYTIPAS